MPQELANTHLLNRTNGVAEDPQNPNNNGGAGITGTLTENLFHQSFGSGSNELKIFKSFFYAQRTVIGKGFKNIQGGIKTAKQHQVYRVGDFLQLFIDNRTKPYESRIGDLFLKLQVSLDYPFNGHVDKFIDPIQYLTFLDRYKATLAESMDFTIFNIIRAMFISSAFETCLPFDQYQRFLMASLAKPTPPNTSSANHPTLSIINAHADFIKKLCDELNGKITNKYVFDVNDFMIRDNRTNHFNPFNPWEYHMGSDKVDNNSDQYKEERLKKCLRVYIPRGTDMTHPTDHQDFINSREESLKAFEIVLSSILVDIQTGIPKHRGGQGNTGNTHPANAGTVDTPTGLPSKVYQNLDSAVPSTKIMDKKFHERPILNVKASKEDLVLVMSKEDYNDFTKGSYRGYLGAQSLAGINFNEAVAAHVSEIIPIDGMCGGHAIILDRRMFAIIPHLTHSGRDTLHQRLANVDTLHQGFIFGMFDQFVGVRIQMVGYTARPIDMTSIFFNYEDPTTSAAPRQ